MASKVDQVASEVHQTITLDSNLKQMFQRIWWTTILRKRQEQWLKDFKIRAIRKWELIFKVTDTLLIKFTSS